MKKNIVFNKAKKLREEGYSFREISEICKISKSTASLWLSNVKISLEGKERLESLKEKAIEKSRSLKKEQKEKYIDTIDKNCHVLKNKISYTNNDLKIFLSLLFWGEGSKKDRRLIFMNSDPKMIKIYLQLLRTTYNINEDKLKATLHLHEYHKKNKMVKYWSKITSIKEKNINIYNKKNSGKRRKEDYKGCISIRYGDVKILDEVKIIIERFFESFAGVG